MNGDAVSSFPDQASLFHVHEVVRCGRLPLEVNDAGFTLGFDADLGQLRIRWADLEAISAFPFWPRFRVAYRHIGGVTCREYRLSPKGGRSLRLLELLDHVEKHRPGRVHRGWIDIPEIHWTDATAWPSETGIETAAYRSNAHSDRRLCETLDQTTSFDRFVLFVCYGPREYRRRLGDFALSKNLLYRRRGGRIGCIPRSALRLRRQTLERKNRAYLQTYYRSLDSEWTQSENGDMLKLDDLPRSRPAAPNLAIYTFGRNLDVFLYDPETNPVALELDKQLVR